MDIRNELGKRILFLDGGMGTMLQEMGLPTGQLPETWNLTHREEMIGLHIAYLEAGADIISANTFGCNEYKFPENGEAVLRAGIENAKAAVERSGKKAYVALDIGSLGKLLKPMGTLDFEDAVRSFGRMMKIGQEAGADLILIETMNDSYELKASVLAAREKTSLPVFATVAFGENGKMLTGCSPLGMVALLEGLGVNGLGVNCGLGPREMKGLCREISSASSTPLIVTPNAGLPRVENGKTLFDVGPEEFAADMAEIIWENNVWIAGGCCGTTPAHIKAMREACAGLTPRPIEEKDLTLVSSGSQVYALGDKPLLIGERINPTGKARFKQALRDGDMDYILNEGVKQADAGAHILDVNVGLPDIQEPEVMERTVRELQEILPLPLQIDTTSREAMERALRIYNGKAMINSVNGKQEIMDEIFPLVKKYGGVVVGLTLDESGIPETAQGRIAIAEKIYREAASYGISRKDIVIDALTMTMSTNPESAKITLDTVKAIHQMGGRTVLGVSNISFGLPQRKLVNAAFFTLALNAGLSAGIVNPGIEEMMEAYDTFLLLAGHDRQCAGYIGKYANQPEEAPLPQATGDYDLQACIIKGLKDRTYEKTREALHTLPPMEVIQSYLVPALDIVGQGFEKGALFLPQLLMSAEAAKAGFEAVKEQLLSSGTAQEDKGTVVIATVKGDIHDIGKNIVKVLLENYGYHVIDLGKDVPPEAVAEAVVSSHAPVAGLSALMTTTVVNMEETIRLLRREAPWCKIMVGGAVLTQEYADKIGADFYGKDAMQSVHYVENLLNQEETK